MRIINIGPVSLYSSAPGSSVQGYMGVEGTTSDQTVDVLWAFGIYNEATGSFSIEGSILDESITFPGLMSTLYETGSFATPDYPGTWDLLGILANEIRLEGTSWIIEGQHSGVYAKDVWTISSVAQLNIVNVGVQGA